MTWRLLYVRPLAEKKVVAALAEIDTAIDTYIPQERVWRGIGARRRPTARPLLPSMVFADLPDDDDLMTFVRHEMMGVSYVITPHDLAPISLSAFVEQMRLAQALGAYDKTISKKVRLEIGQRVMIKTGNGAGHAALIVGMSQSRRAKLIADVYGSPKRVQADEVDLEAIEEGEREAA